MTGYSGTPLTKKLGIKAGFKIYIKNPPKNYNQLIEPIPENVVLTKRLSNDLDMVHVFTKSRGELALNIPAYIEKIKPDGMIWVSWPKKAFGVATDVTEDVIGEIILPLQLVDIKVCAVDEVWPGLKLVIRKENRLKA